MSATSFTALLSTDPFFLYTLIAALFLGFVSLWSGWRRRDFLTLFTPQGLLHISLAVLLAFALTLLSQYVLSHINFSSDGDGVSSLESLRSLSRFPLYVIALAYGPSAGLLAAGLFASFATTTALPGWPEAVLALELTVLGWFAIAPSPRAHRWAGPLDALMAYFLAWATGGSAMLQALTGEGVQWASHANYHATLALGAGLSMVLLIFVGPRTYRKLFPNSRISPRTVAPASSEAATPPAPPRRRAFESPPTFGSLWGNEVSNPFVSKGRWQLTFTPPSELAQKANEAATRERRTLDELSLTELRAGPERRHSDADIVDVTQFKRQGRTPKELEPPSLEDT